MGAMVKFGAGNDPAKTKEFLVPGLLEYVVEYYGFLLTFSTRRAGVNWSPSRDVCKFLSLLRKLHRSVLLPFLFLFSMSYR
jgi:hypothetical protein